MDIVIKINGTDRTNYVNWQSLRIENVLTKQVDTCSFTITNYEGKIYKPTLEDDVQIFADGTKIFGGNVKKITERIVSDKLLVYDIDCVDYTRLMDKEKVAESYSNTSVEDIINDIKNYYFSDFTTNNVSCSTVINSVIFNYEIPSKCLERLAELAGYDWYVDYDKDIHFFQKGNEVAPFSLTDESANYIYNSLVFKRDTSQMKNSVYVRGGEYLGDTYTEYHTGDGTKKVFNLAYKYTNISVTVGGTAQTVGIDNVDSEDDYDCLYNYSEKVIRFKDSNVPSSGTAVNITGNPHVPIIINRKDVDSITTYGEFSSYTYDNRIKTRQEAIDYANALLALYASPQIVGAFQTYETGLRSGQQLTINSTIRGINETVLIDRVSMRMISPSDLIYNVHFVSTKDYGIIDILAGLMINQNKNSLNDIVEFVDREWTIPSETILLADSTPNFRDRETGPWYVGGGSNTPVGYCGFCQAS